MYDILNFFFSQKKHMNKRDPLAVEDCAMIKWEGAVGIDAENRKSISLPLTNKRYSPVSVITSPPCQPRTPPPHTLQPVILAATTTATTTATSVLIKSESID